MTVYLLQTFACRGRNALPGRTSGPATSFFVAGVIDGSAADSSSSHRRRPQMLIAIAQSQLASEDDDDCLLHLTHLSLLLKLLMR